ncbi:MAG: hypothetical protein QXU98_11385 [Candidatus Parvarchaeota archaeon]
MKKNSFTLEFVDSTDIPKTKKQKFKFTKKQLSYLESISSSAMKDNDGVTDFLEFSKEAINTLIQDINENKYPFIKANKKEFIGLANYLIDIYNSSSSNSFLFAVL